MQRADCRWGSDTLPGCEIEALQADVCAGADLVVLPAVEGEVHFRRGDPSS